MRQQRNMSQTKEQDKTPTEQLSGDSQPICERVQSNHCKRGSKNLEKE